MVILLYKIAENEVLFSKFDTNIEQNLHSPLAIYDIFSQYMLFWLKSTYFYYFLKNFIRHSSLFFVLTVAIYIPLGREPT